MTTFSITEIPLLPHGINDVTFDYCSNSGNHLRKVRVFAVTKTHNDLLVRGVDLLAMEIRSYKVSKIENLAYQGIPIDKAIWIERVSQALQDYEQSSETSPPKAATLLDIRNARLLEQENQKQEQLEQLFAIFVERATRAVTEHPKSKALAVYVDHGKSVIGFNEMQELYITLPLKDYPNVSLLDLGNYLAGNEFLKGYQVKSSNDVILLKIV